MITIEEISIKRAKTEWLTFQKEILSLSPFQEYEFNRILVKHYLFPFKSLRPRFYIFKENGKTVCIAPMCEDLRAKEKTLMTLGAKPELALQDWLYDNNMPIDKMCECIKLLQSKFPRLFFRRLSDGTVLFSALTSMTDPTGKHKNVIFETPAKYEDWYGSLSKNMKQTIRTMYNRLSADNVQYELCIKKGNEIDKKEYAELMSVLTSRKMQRYGYSRLLSYYMRYFYYHTAALRKMGNTMFFITKMNGEIASFHAGYLYKNGKTVILPNAAMNGKFSFYSPGVLLVCEIFRIVKHEYGIDYYDMSKDDELYKLRLGGEVYYTYDFNFQ